MSSKKKRFKYWLSEEERLKGTWEIKFTCWMLEALKDSVPLHEFPQPKKK